NHADFQSAYQFIEQMEFGEMHVFPYSRRPNTKAYQFPNVVDETTKKNRVHELLTLNAKKALGYRQLFVGSIQEVIIEKVIQGIAFGHTANYLEVQFPTIFSKKHDFVKVQITEAGYPVSQAIEVKNV
ncbi:MAG TPA: TRAM domain-containing protein, partial [Bacilli bacterium]|nr:TRAM domain-containing protein [Bacilli bacterium]